MKRVEIKVFGKTFYFLADADQASQLDKAMRDGEQPFVETIALGHLADPSNKLMKFHFVVQPATRHGMELV
jgi:hypothetical protein